MMVCLVGAILLEELIEFRGASARLTYVVVRRDWDS